MFVLRWFETGIPSFEYVGMCGHNIPPFSCVGTCTDFRSK